MSCKPFSRFGFITLAALCLSSTGAFAGKPHVHGIATLNLSLSDTEIEVSLDSPADNLVGFEHQPRTDKQRAAAEQAVKRLQNVDSLIRFTADGGCKLKEADIDSPFDTDNGHDDKHHHHGEKHDHSHDDEHHHHGKKHDHDHDDEHHHHGEKHDHSHDDEHHHHGKKHDHDHDHDGDAHSDFEAEYEFHCKNTAAVQSVDLKGFFTHFHNFQTINVNWAGKHGQSSARATQENPLVKLKK